MTRPDITLNLTYDEGRKLLDSLARDPEQLRQSTTGETERSDLYWKIENALIGSMFPGQKLERGAQIDKSPV